MTQHLKAKLHTKSLRIVVIITTLTVLVLVGVAFAQTLRTGNQISPAITKDDPLVEQVKNSANQPIGILQDDDTPLKITEATVKEVSAADFQKLTSEKSDLQSVMSVPTATMVNVSDKTITKVMFNIYDSATDRGQGIYMRGLSIKPGDTFRISPDNFLKQDMTTTVNEKNEILTSVNPSLKNKNAWLPFADKAQVQVRVAVDFEDGTKWFNKSQRGKE